MRGFFTESYSLGHRGFFAAADVGIVIAGHGDRSGRFVTLASNEGRSKGRNRLSRHARSAALLFLDSDDTLAPGGNGVGISDGA